MSGAGVITGAIALIAEGIYSNRKHQGKNGWRLGLLLQTSGIDGLFSPINVSSVIRHFKQRLLCLQRREQTRCRVPTFPFARTWTSSPRLQRRDARGTSTLLSSSHRSPSLGQNAIRLLKCHFQKEMDYSGGTGSGERIRYLRTNNLCNQITPVRSSSLMTKQLSSVH